ncbi:lymphocyte antigen 6D isoform X2 [Ailuropoda melanoleuca]|uniref:lymphocyte antigen 6D isoform X2 n=1 Tax=Ailuropoda melanoleuca TaxID=9646 RepID=UPI0009482681|nr:lymphocyte antigen 6D isoform X2 [Ailuropoda melanoleuca]
MKVASPPGHPGPEPEPERGRRGSELQSQLTPLSIARRQGTEDPCPGGTCPSYKASREEGPPLLPETPQDEDGPAAPRCAGCDRWASSTNCERAQNCAAGARYCRTRTKLEPLTGNLVEKDCVESCTPTHSLPGQVSSGAAATLCCQDDLCNRSLQSSAPARTLLPGAALGLALALGLLALIAVPSL